MKLVEITPWLDRKDAPPPGGPACPKDGSHGRTEKRLDPSGRIDYYCPMCCRTWTEDKRA